MQNEVGMFDIRYRLDFANFLNVHPVKKAIRRMTSSIVCTVVTGQCFFFLGGVLAWMMLHFLLFAIFSSLHFFWACIFICCLKLWLSVRTKIRVSVYIYTSSGLRNHKAMSVKVKTSNKVATLNYSVQMQIVLRADCLKIRTATKWKVCTDNFAQLKENMYNILCDSEICETILIRLYCSIWIARIFSGN